jgi:uncharacterized protein (DUF1330 family)
MKAKIKLTLAVLAGAALGAAAIQGLNAQGKPVVYLIEEIDISNPDAFAKEFLPLILAANKAAGVRSLAGGKATVIEGTPPKSRVAIQVWDSIESIQAYRSSAAYKEARKVADKYATYRTFAVEGLPQ